MLNIAHYQRKANQNYNEVLSHTGQNAHHQKKSINNKWWRGCGEKGTLLLCWWKCKLIQPLWRTVRRFLKKLGIKLTNHPTIPLLTIHPNETITEKDTCTSMFIAALSTIAKTQKQLRCLLTDEWITKSQYIYKMEYYSVIKKEYI